jgi:cyclohexanone monooxygenase
VVVQGVKYEVDCIIYATGFEVGTSLIRRAGFETYGRDGITLSQAWSDGMRSKHGIHVRNFPNAFLVQPTQGGNLIINVPHNILESAMTIAMMVRHAEDRGCQTIEVSQQAQDAWIELLLKGPGMTLGSPDCTPGYYNNEGRAMVPQARYAVGYPAGAPVFFRYIKEWRESGDFEGIEFA